MGYKWVWDINTQHKKPSIYTYLVKGYFYHPPFFKMPRIASLDLNPRDG